MPEVLDSEPMSIATRRTTSAPSRCQPTIENFVFGHAALIAFMTARVFVRARRHGFFVTGPCWRGTQCRPRRTSRP